MAKKDDYKANAKKNKNKKTYEAQIDNKEKETVVTKKPKKKYKNPATTLAGKILIVTISLLTAFSGLITLIYLLVTRS